MPEYTYANVISRIEPFFEKIRSVGVPDRVAYSWLQTIGFTSSNDRSLKNVLSFLNFIDDDDKPTELWQNYRGKNHKRVLAGAIKQGYEELYKTYPIAHKLSSDELTSFFNAQSKSGPQVVSRTVSTFKKLCDMADFSDIQNEKTSEKSADKESEGNKVLQSQQSELSLSENTPSIHINIQFHLSPEMSSDQIDAIFKSMSKHLYK